MGYPRIALTVILVAAGSARADGVVDAVVRRFADSNFEFLRAQSNAPFFPLAWATVTGYEEGAFSAPDGNLTTAKFQQSSIAEGFFLPLPAGKRDAFVVGEWASKTRFDLKGSGAKDLDVFSVSVPVGWIRQSSPAWQLAAFVAPLGHTTHEDGWYWETLGGIFARHTTSDRLAWVFGAYFDVAPLEDFYTPYLGATYVVDERWTLNAIMPWPSVIYAPGKDVFFRLGVAPSGTSWSVEPGVVRPRMNFSAWNLGLAVERRLTAGFWLGFEAGISGIRGLSIVGGDFQPLETKLDRTGFALITVNFRPDGPVR